MDPCTHPPPCSSSFLASHIWKKNGQITDLKYLITGFKFDSGSMILTLKTFGNAHFWLQNLKSQVVEMGMIDCQRVESDFSFKKTMQTRWTWSVIYQTEKWTCLFLLLNILNIFTRLRQFLPDSRHSLHSLSARIEKMLISYINSCKCKNKCVFILNMYNKH